MKKIFGRKKKDGEDEAIDGGNNTVSSTSKPKSKTARASTAAMPPTPMPEQQQEIPFDSGDNNQSKNSNRRSINVSVGDLEAIPSDVSDCFNSNNSGYRLMDSLQLSLSMLTQISNFKQRKEEEWSSYEYSMQETLFHELNELYSYAEMKQLQQTKREYDAICELIADDDSSDEEGIDNDSEDEAERILEQHRTLIEFCLDLTENAQPKKRYTAAMALLYFANGVCQDCNNIEEQLHMVQINSAILYDCGALPVFIEALVMERKRPDHEELKAENIKLYCNLLYIMILCNCYETREKYKEDFKNQLANTTFEKGQTLIEILIGMLQEGSSVQETCIPIRKVLLLLWKSLMVVCDTPTYKLDTYDPVHPDMHVKAVAEDLEAFTSKYLPGQNVPKCVLEAEEVYRRHMFTPSHAKSEKNKTGRYNAPPRSLLVNPPYIERLYKKLLPDMPNFVLCILKVFLAAIPTVKNYTGSINLSREVLQERLQDMRQQQQQQQQAGGVNLSEVDFTRHKEIILKAVSAILFMLMKEFKKNNVLQAEYLSQLISDANGILLILKFFNQDILQYLKLQHTKNEMEDMVTFSNKTIPLEDDERHVASAGGQGDNELLPLVASSNSKTERASDSRTNKSSSSPTAVAPLPKEKLSWRNIFCVINFLRLLHKLTKNYPVRISVLIQYKAQIILKRFLKIPHQLVRLYSLKIIKGLVPFMKSKWRQSNMKVISMIYKTVRPNMRDVNWLVTDDNVNDPKHIQADDEKRSIVKEFNNRNYLEWWTHANQEATLPPPVNLAAAAAATSKIVVEVGRIAGEESRDNDAVNDADDYDQHFGDADYVYTGEGSFQPAYRMVDELDSIELSAQFKENYQEWLNKSVYQHM